MKVFVIFLPNMFMEIKMNLFYKHELKNEIKTFSHKKLKFHPRT